MTTLLDVLALIALVLAIPVVAAIELLGLVLGAVDNLLEGLHDRTQAAAQRSLYE